jgi:hypothetical protein
VEEEWKAYCHAANAPTSSQKVDVINWWNVSLNLF